MEQVSRRRVGVCLVAVLASAAIAEGCTPPEPTEPSSSSAGGEGGAGGAGGEAGAGGSGGQGGGEVGCLDPSAAMGLFTITDPSFCIVATYEADMSGVGTPTWGSHGGPLTLSRAMGSASVDLLRWKLPAGRTGKLSAEATHVDAMLAANVFVNDQALDLPFFGWTAFSWANAFPNTSGEIVVVKGGSIAKRYVINGALSMASVASDAEHGRLLVSSLSPIADATAAKNGLYAADSCGTAANPDLLPGQDTTCTSPIAVSTWGDASGPVAADRDGNVFAVMTQFAGDQEARGFAAATIARGQGPTLGAPLFTLPGFGSSLAALGPQAGLPGKLLFQPFNSSSGAAEDVIAQGYSVSGASMKAEGSASVFLKLEKSNTTLSLMRDDQDRLWVGAALASGSTFVVISRSR